MSSETALLPLDAPRVAAFTDNKRPYILRFRRLQQADWERFLGGVAIESRREGAETVNVIDVSSTAVDLVERTIESAKGYAEGFTDDPNWKKMIPLGHQKIAAEILQDVIGRMDDGPLDPRRVRVLVDATWTGDAEKGEMKRFAGLVHVFGPPTGEHKRKFTRAASESRVVGGPTHGTTLHVPRRRILLDFYDQLILAVEGYSMGGVEISDVEVAKREMDGAHKVAAIAQLFADPDAQEAAVAA
jgi:hypothetical protein